MTLEILWLHIARSAADEDHHHAVAAADSQAFIRLETTSRKTQPHVAQSH